MGPCSQWFNWRVCIKWCDRVHEAISLTSGVCLQACDCVGNVWDLLYALLLLAAQPLHRKWWRGPTTVIRTPADGIPTPIKPTSGLAG